MANEQQAKRDQELKRKQDILGSPGKSPIKPADVSPSPGIGSLAKEVKIGDKHDAKDSDSDLEEGEEEGEEEIEDELSEQSDDQ